VSLVHSTLEAAGFGATAAATAACIVGATISSFAKSTTITYRLGLRLNRLVLTYLLMGMLILEQQRTALRLCAVLMA
jgi:hypothetical protein